MQARLLKDGSCGDVNFEALWRIRDSRSETNVLPVKSSWKYSM